MTYNGQFSIEDRSGGISRKHAETEVFNFGHSADVSGAKQLQLGAYGIGLKRAIFKIGNQFEMISKTATEGFRVKVDVGKWADDDKQLIKDWKFPMEYLDGAKSPEEAGTQITISEIHDDIKALFADRTVEIALHRAIGQTYAPFLARFATIELNGKSVDAIKIPLGASKEFRPAVESWEEDGVRITLMAGLAARGAANEWRSEQAGWYVVCNGRIILAADKSELTGWGAGILPQFHSSKSRGFVGIASFSSSNPLKLPWTTTKRSLNRESAIFLKVRDRMATIARPVYSFLDGLYASKSDVTADERRITTHVLQADLFELMKRSSGFETTPKKRKPKTTTKIQYDAEIRDLEAIREHLNQNMPAATIGKYTFDYYLEQEGIR